MTLMTVMTINCKGSLNGARHSAVESRDRVRGRQPKERKAVKERCRYEARSAYLFPNISPCSDRDRRRARPIGAGIARHTSSSQRSPGPRRVPMPYPDDTFTIVVAV